MDSYKETLNFLFGLETFGIRPGLKRVRWLLGLMGNPQNKINTVTIAGTNGKGSTGATLASILSASGYRVGLYTSPHLIRFNERIRIDDLENTRGITEEITNDEIVEYVRDIWKIIREKGRDKGTPEGFPTFFEFTTALAFKHFLHKGVDIAVIETGLGGRLDATNVIRSPLLSIITSIGIDHTRYLGRSITGIARDKAGIIKREVPVVTGEIENGPLKVIKDRAEKMGSRVYCCKKDFSAERGRNGGLTYRGKYRYQKLSLKLKGSHQLVNSACAIKGGELLKERGFEGITEGSVRKGLRTVKWPGRFEEIRSGGKKVILDCGHNEDGALALKRTIEEEGLKNITLLLGILADKDIESILAPLVPLGRCIITTSPEIKRALPARELQDLCRNYITGDKVILRRRGKTSRALKLALDLTPRGGAVVVAGSVFTVGEAKCYINRTLKTNSR